MKCPNCNETLLMTERNNIEIDYCPSCRGVWLDRGELDKMLAFPAQHNNGHDTAQPYTSGSRYQDTRDKQPRHQQPYQKPYKKKSFLGDLFDFD